MKKIEAQELAIDRANLVIEYINQILGDGDKVNSTMNFWYAKIDGQLMNTLDIYVSENKFEKHLNLGITKDHSLVLYEQVLNDLLDNYLDSENMGISKHYVIKSMNGTFSGVDVINLDGGKIKINFNKTDPNFMDIVKKYNDKCLEYENKSTGHSR